MTERPHRFFIFSPKEVITLLLIGSLVAFLSFTLGLHYGKRLGGGAFTPVTEQNASSEGAPLDAGDAISDPNPRAEDLDAKMEWSKPEAVDKLVTEALKKEIEKEGLSLNEPKPTQLPEPGEHLEEKTPAPNSRASRSAGNAYAIQIASYPKLREAEKRVALLKVLGLEADILEAQVAKMGTRYRVLVGSFSTKAEATTQGKKWLSQKKIGEFVLILKPEND